MLIGKDAEAGASYIRISNLRMPIKSFLTFIAGVTSALLIVVL